MHVLQTQRRQVSGHVKIMGLGGPKMAENINIGNLQHFWQFFLTPYAHIFNMAMWLCWRGDSTLKFYASCENQ